MGAWWGRVSAALAAFWGWFTGVWAVVVASRPFTIASAIVVGALCLVVGLKLIGLIFGWWAPDFKRAWDRWSDNQGQVVVNKLDKSSLKSEKESGIIAKAIKDDTPLYDKDGNICTWPDDGKDIILNKGDVVMPTSLAGKPADSKSEGMVEVLLPNRQGAFVGNSTKGCPKGWIPTRFIDLDT